MRKSPKWCIIVIAQKPKTPQRIVHQKTRKNQLYLPLNLEKIIEPNESVRTLDEICEQLDYSELNKSYLRKRSIDSATPEAI